MTTRETELTTQVAALEAEIVSLRDVIFDMAGEEPGISWGKARKALSTPFNPTALNELIEKVENNPELICPRCKVDRFKQPCPGPLHLCPIKGEAQ